ASSARQRLARGERGFVRGEKGFASSARQQFTLHASVRKSLRLSPGHSRWTELRPRRAVSLLSNASAGNVELSSAGSSHPPHTLKPHMASDPAAQPTDLEAELGEASGVLPAQRLREAVTSGFITAGDWRRSEERR